MTTTLYGNPPSTTYTQLLQYEAFDGVNRNIYVDDGSGGVLRMPITFDRTNSRVGVMNAAPTVPLDVTGAAKISTTLVVPSLDGVAPTVGGLVIGVGATSKLGFYGHAVVAQQTGVAVSAAGIHAACVALGLFTA